MVAFRKALNKGRYTGHVALAVVALALFLRYAQANIGQPHIYFWDEPQTAATALKMIKTVDNNPHFLNNGTLTIYLNVFIDKLHLLGVGLQASDIIINADTGWHWSISHPEFCFWNRLLTAVFFAGTIGLVFMIGRHVFNA